MQDVREQRGRWYDLAALAVIGLFLVLLLRVRASLPVFYDSWYHLSVIRAFFERGFTWEAWWEYAPFGRPHLYPPLFHVAGAATLQVTGCNLLDLGRLYDVVMFPLLLLAGWGAARCFWGKRAAFATLLLLAANCALLFPASLIMMPGTVAVALWPFVFVLLLRQRPVWASLVLAVIGWLHFGMWSLAVASVALFAVVRREFFKRAILVVVTGATLVSPWLLHLYWHREFLHPATGQMPVFLPVLTVLGAGAGIAVTVRRREPAAVAALALLVATGFLFFTTRDKFWIYGGFFLALLGGYGIQRLSGRCWPWAVAALLAGSVWVTPFLRPAAMKLALPIPGQNWPGMLGTPLGALVAWQRPAVAARIPPAVPDDLGGLAHWIMKQVGREEIIVTDDPLLGGALFALTGRRTSWGMWGEVMTRELEGKLAEFRRMGGRYVIGQESPGDGAVVVAEFGRYRMWQR